MMPPNSCPQRGVDFDMASFARALSAEPGQGATLLLGLRGGRQDGAANPHGRENHPPLSNVDTEWSGQQRRGFHAAPVRLTVC